MIRVENFIYLSFVLYNIQGIKLCSRHYLMTKTIARIITVSFTSILLGSSIASADVIEDRKAGFRGNVTALKAIRAAMSENDTATIATNAGKIAAWFDVMPNYFPEGSNTGKTNARPEIWTNWEKFTSISATARQSALDLAMAANAGDSDGINAGFQAVAGTCKTCHQSFKN